MTRIMTRIFALILAGNCCLAESSQELRVVTRFGTLTIGESNMLLLKGHPLDPPIQGNNSLDIGEPFRIGAADVVLVTDLGGTACPYLYYFITLRKSGAKATRSFGTCNQATEVARRGNSIIVTMRGFRGPFEPPAERRKVEKQTHVFVFLEGIVTEDGNPVK